MTLSQFEKYLDTLTSHVIFEYKGLKCGIDPLALNHFDMWCGKDYYKATSIDEVMTYRLFDGMSLTEIFDNIEKVEY